MTYSDFLRCPVTSSIRYFFSALMVGLRLEFAVLGARELHARAHRGRERDALDVVAFERGRLGLAHGLEDRGNVLGDLVGGEGALADADADVGGLVDLELNTAGL